MRILWTLLLTALLVGCAGDRLARAQQSVIPGYQVCSTASGITECSFQPVSLAVGLPVNVVAGSLTASLAPFGPSAAGSRMTPLTVTTSDSSGTLPTGAATVVTNAGANPMYCNTVGVAATTSDQYISSNGGWFVFVPAPAVTTLHCIATGGNTTANGQGGSGLPAGTGGGSGGGGGTVTQGNAGSNAQAWWTQIGDAVRGPAKVQAGNAAAVADVALTVTDPNVLAAIQLAIPSQSPTVPIGGVSVCDGANGATNPCTSAQTVLAGSTASAAANKPAVVALHPSSGTPAQINQYPFGATPLTASATGTTGATTATLAGTGGKTTYICGYSIRANATANTNVTNTITGVITATLSSIMWVPANTAGLGVDEQIFSPCIPASGTNQAIAIVSGAPGTGGLVSAKGWGYQL